MNNLDARYQALLEDILQNGVEKKDRTGTGTISVFGRQIRHKMSEGFPLLTTKKMHWNSVVTELLWFLRGETNIKFLLDYDCHIWDGDAYKRYLEYTIMGVNNGFDRIEGHLDNCLVEHDSDYEHFTNPSFQYGYRPHTKEEFINKIKTNETFAKQWGELGPIYGKQWREWGGELVTKRIKEEGRLPYSQNVIEGQIDQIQNLINELKTNPDSRRLMVNAWNVGELDQMVLPPCHYGFQVYTIVLTLDERAKQHQNPNIFYDIHGSFNIGDSIENSDMTIEDREWLHGKFDEGGIPKRAISLMWNQRSVDTFLGLPFNIASYGLLLEIIAKEVNMVPDELIGNLGDVHLYSNHIEQAKEQIGRTPYELPTVKITERNWYMHEAVKEHLGEKTLDEKLKSYRPDCFELIGYESHPKIKAPLSN
jgi:thymidylate synthase